MENQTDTILEYIELEYQWDEAKLDEYQRMACFPDEFKKWIPNEITKLRDKRYRLGNELKLEKDRPWREVFQQRIQEQIDELNKWLRTLNMSSSNKNNREANLLKIKQIPITDLYIGRLRKMGNVLAGICPFHKEKTASFRIYPRTNTWHCFGCDSGNDVVDFVMKRDGVDFNEALKRLKQ